MTLRPTLPIDSLLPRIITLLEKQGVVVISSPPGSGKTTRIPPALCQLTDQKIALLQPRRMAARLSCERIAMENNWTVAKEVGYAVRFDRQIGADTKLQVLTEGLFTKLIQFNNNLDGFGIVILDEFHERNLHTDFAAAWIKYLRRTRRPDLKIVIMSATINVEFVSQFFDNAPIIQANGQLYPLEVYHRELSLNYNRPQDFYETMAITIKEALSHSDYQGDVLAFLPGAGEIERLRKILLTMELDLDIFPLHGQLPQKDQDKAVYKGSRRKIILATNIAESSLTVEGVQIIVDSGLAKVMRFDSEVGVDQLSLQRISKASADQRAGRAARQHKGICFRLWTKVDHRRMNDFQAPEILRTDLTDLMLLLMTLLPAEEPLEFPTRWTQESEVYSLKVLELMGALKLNYLTPFGRLLASLNCGHRQGSLLIHGYHSGHFEDAALMASLLEGGDIIKKVSPDQEFDQANCDIAYRLGIFKDRQYYGKNEVNSSHLKRVNKSYQALLKMRKVIQGKSIEILPYLKGRDFDLAQLLLLSYPDRLVERRKNKPFKGKMLGGRGVILSEFSCVKSGSYFLGLNPTNLSNRPKAEAQVSFASKIEASWIRHYFKDRLTIEKIIYDDRNGLSIEKEADCFMGIPVSKLRPLRLSPQEKKEKAINLIISDWDQFLLKFPALNLLHLRLLFLNKYCPQISLPQLDPKVNKEEIRSILELIYDDYNKVDKWKDDLVQDYFFMLMDEAQKDFIDKEAPIFLKLPNGKGVKVLYDHFLRPKISVYLQALLGEDFCPLLGLGQYALTIELLAPNGRAAQVTNNLSQFWKKNYFEVRKELAGRYPKHYWPMDPTEGKG